MSAFDMVTAGSGVLRAGRVQHPGALSADHAGYRSPHHQRPGIHRRVTRFTDPKEIVRRTAEFQKRAFYYYQNWESL